MSVLEPTDTIGADAWSKNSPVAEATKLETGELAEMLGVSQRQLLRWEKDEGRRRPKAIEELAQTLGVPVSDLTTNGQAPALQKLAADELQQMLSYVPRS